MVFKNMEDHLMGKTEAYECEYRIRAKNGQWKWFGDRGTVALRDSENRPLIIKGVVFDITAEKTVQKELEKKNEELRRLVETKNLMFSIISHDLRGPLGALDMLLNDVADADSLAGQTKLLRELSLSTRNLYALVNNLLEWSAFQRGEFEVHREKHSIFEIAQAAFKDVKLTADQKKIKIVNKICPDIEVLCDEKMITTVIRNLVSNAIKYSPKDSIIEFSDNVADGKAEIKIKDHGIGIPEDKLDNLFKISSTKSTKGTDGEKGTGLGLVLCKDFIQKNGGSIHVESKLGEGSVFTLSLQLAN